MRRSDVKFTSCVSRDVYYTEMNLPFFTMVNNDFEYAFADQTIWQTRSREISRHFVETPNHVTWNDPTGNMQLKHVKQHITPCCIAASQEKIFVVLWMPYSKELSSYLSPHIFESFVTGVVLHAQKINSWSTVPLPIYTVQLQMS